MSIRIVDLDIDDLRRQVQAARRAPSSIRVVSGWWEWGGVVETIAIGPLERDLAHLDHKAASAYRQITPRLTSR
jgi:hypothetical protein